MSSIESGSPLQQALETKAKLQKAEKVKFRIEEKLKSPLPEGRSPETYFANIAAFGSTWVQINEQLPILAERAAQAELILSQERAKKIADIQKLENALSRLSMLREKGSIAALTDRIAEAEIALDNLRKEAAAIELLQPVRKEKAPIEKSNIIEPVKEKEEIKKEPVIEPIQEGKITVSEPEKPSEPEVVEKPTSQTASTTEAQSDPEKESEKEEQKVQIKEASVATSVDKEDLLVKFEKELAAAKSQFVKESFEGARGSRKTTLSFPGGDITVSERAAEVIVGLTVLSLTREQIEKVFNLTSVQAGSLFAEFSIIKDNALFKIAAQSLPKKPGEKGRERKLYSVEVLGKENSKNSSSEGEKTPEEALKESAGQPESISIAAETESTAKQSETQISNENNSSEQIAETLIRNGEKRPLNKDSYHIRRIFAEALKSRFFSIAEINISELSAEELTVLKLLHNTYKEYLAATYSDIAKVAFPGEKEEAGKSKVNTIVTKFRNITFRANSCPWAIHTIIPDKGPGKKENRYRLYNRQEQDR